MNKPKSKVSIPTMKKELQGILDKKKIKGKVIRSAIGPRITRFYISLEPGVNVKKVERCAEEIATRFDVTNIRILASIPGKELVGVEIPNGRDEMVDLRQLLEDGGRAKQMMIPLVLGKGFSGKTISLDLAQAPHILIAGVNASEISMVLNAMVMSLLHRFSPESMQLVLFHPGKTCLPGIRGQMPVIHGASQMIAELHKTAAEMDDRYKFLQSAKAKTLREYNEHNNIPNTPQSTRLPYKIIFIGELASLQKDKSWHNAEIDVCRIAQMGRAAGIHLVVATQYPTSRNIISGIIKANLPTRIAFRVDKVNESRLVLDMSGAETLLGGGDMLMMSYDAKVVRAQCASSADFDSATILLPKSWSV